MDIKIIKAIIAGVILVVMVFGVNFFLSRMEETTGKEASEKPGVEIDVVSPQKPVVQQKIAGQEIAASAFISDKVKLQQREQQEKAEAELHQRIAEEERITPRFSGDYLLN